MEATIVFDRKDTWAAAGGDHYIREMQMLSFPEESNDGDERTFGGSRITTQ